MNTHIQNIFANFYSLGLRKRILAYISTTILLLICAYFNDIAPLRHKINTLNAQAKQLQQQLSTQTKLAHSRSKNTTKELDSEYKKFDFAWVLQSLNKIIAQTHINLDTLQPQLPQTENGLTSYRTKIVASGNFEQLQKFLHATLQLPYAFAAEEIIWQKTASNNLSLQLLLQFYAMPDGNSLLFHNLKSQKPINHTQDLFALASSTTTTSITLQNYLSAELRYIGMIEQDGRTLGIVADPTGTTFQLKVGDKIGVNNSQIIAINPQAILTTKPQDNLYEETP